MNNKFFFFEVCLFINDIATGTNSGRKSHTQWPSQAKSLAKVGGHFNKLSACRQWMRQTECKKSFHSRSFINISFMFFFFFFYPFWEYFLFRSEGGRNGVACQNSRLWLKGLALTLIYKLDIALISVQAAALFMQHSLRYVYCSIFFSFLSFF